MEFLPDRFLRPLLSLPTAPYHEHHVFRWILEQTTAWPETLVETDAYGNLLLQVHARPRRPLPLLLVAHLDHPGFVVIPSGKVHFLGGVAEKYFAGQSVRFHRTDTLEITGTATVRRVQRDGETLWADLDGSTPLGQFGVWDLPGPRINQRTITATAIDDLAGVAAILTVLESCAHEGTSAGALLTRAEEVGFHGTLAWLKAAPAKDRPTVISIEMSHYPGYAEPGAGPVLRVGDRARVFSPDVLRWMQDTLDGLATEGDFYYQRKLMAGGTCEGTPFAHAGFPTGALCLPLENYHNQGPDGQIAPESVQRRDWDGLVQALVRLAHTPFRSGRLGPLDRRLRTLTQAGVRALRRQPLS